MALLWHATPHHTYHIPYYIIPYHTIWDPYVHCMALCLHTMYRIPHGTRKSTLTTIHTNMPYLIDPYVHFMALRILNIPRHTCHTCHTRRDPYVTLWYYHAHFMSLCMHITPQHTINHVVPYHTIWDPYVHCMPLCLHAMSTIPHETHISTWWLYVYIPYTTTPYIPNMPYHLGFACPFGALCISTVL